MTDTDSAILTIAQRLYHWSSEDNISILIQFDDNSSHDNSSPGLYYCYIILSSGLISNFFKLKDWKMRQVLCCTSGESIPEAKQNLLNELLKKAREALEVPIEQVMKS